MAQSFSLPHFMYSETLNIIIIIYIFRTLVMQVARNFLKI